MKKICVILVMMLVATTLMRPVMAEGESVEISAEKRENIVRNCDSIHNTLVNLQHSDTRTRVYLGRYYETVISDFITPLNVWLVTNNMPDAKLLENQNNLVARRARFINDYIEYQKGLEGLVAIDCETEPEKFYVKLLEVREKRAAVASDVTKMRTLMSKQMELVTNLKERL